MNNRYAVILCGGSGTRLLPMSRTLRPKQLLALNGSDTLLQQTAKRLASNVPAKHLFTVTHENHKFEVKGQLGEVIPDAVANVLVEPYARNTLPAIAWAVSKIFEQNQDAIIGVFASDHAIDNEDTFQAAWEVAEKAATDGYLVLLGIKPHEPVTGYGYIKPGKSLKIDDLPVLDVEQFVEKPSPQKAIQFVRDGYLWNSGMFVFNAKTFLHMLNKYQPEMAIQLKAMKDENFHEIYKNFTNISIDYGLAEKAEKIAVIPVDMAWSDLGSWDSIYQKQAKNLERNVIHGNVIAQDTKDSLLWTQHGVLATLGLSNVVVIQTADATLVCDRSRAEDIKTLVAQVKEHNIELTEIHQTAHRPWGTYTTLEEGDRFKIKRIVVRPGGRLSLQMHHHRSEHWVVVSGIAKVTNGEKVFFVSPNESTFIPAGCNHRLENPGVMDLIMIEVQSGDYVGEDDIVRFDDSYGRVGQ